MSDHHMRILRRVARQSQRELEQHDAVDHAVNAASTRRREYLERTAKRTRARVANAQQRRSRRPHDHRDTPDQPPAPPALTGASRPAESPT